MRVFYYSLLARKKQRESALVGPADGHLVGCNFVLVSESAFVLRYSFVFSFSYQSTIQFFPEKPYHTN